MLTKLDSNCVNLSNTLIVETQTLQSLDKFFLEGEPETFNVEKYISFSSSLEKEKVESSNPQP